MSTYERLLAEAAEARSAGVRAPSDRPSQRRWADEPGAGPLVRQRAEIVIRAAADDSGLLTFDGFASVYNRGYDMWDMFGPYSESVRSGAGAASLATPGLDVPFVLAHDTLRRIARTTNGTLTLSETSAAAPQDLAAGGTGGVVEGLRVEASLDPADADVAYIAPKLRAGLIDEMSFRFRITAGEWSPDFDAYTINEYDINRGDVAIVGYGANPHTQGAGLRGGEYPDLRDWPEARLRELGNRLHAERKARGGSGMSFEDLERATRAVLIPPVD